MQPGLKPHAFIALDHVCFSQANVETRGAFMLIAVPLVVALGLKAFARRSTSSLAPVSSRLGRRSLDYPVSLLTQACRPCAAVGHSEGVLAMLGVLGEQLGRKGSDRSTVFLITRVQDLLVSLNVGCCTGSWDGSKTRTV